MFTVWRSYQSTFLTGLLCKLHNIHATRYEKINGEMEQMDVSIITCFHRFVTHLNDMQAGIIHMEKCIHQYHEMIQLVWTPVDSIHNGILHHTAFCIFCIIRYLFMATRHGLIWGTWNTVFKNMHRFTVIITPVLHQYQGQHNIEKLHLNPRDNYKQTTKATALH